jgi:hypothetical protein
LVKARREETAALEGVVEEAVPEAVPVLAVAVPVPTIEELAPDVVVVTGRVLAVLKKKGLNYHTVSK